MLDRAIRGFAIAACVLVGLGFTLFAVDELSEASSRQVGAVVNPGPSEEQTRDEQLGTARRVIEDAGDVLLAPFAAAGADSSNGWVSRGLPTLLALLAYGLGLMYLANWIRTRA